MAKTPRPPVETSKVEMKAHETWEIFAGLLLAAWLLSYMAIWMKTEQKYSELIVFVFYIMNRFLT
jgi:hypothetical protein